MGFKSIEKIGICQLAKMNYKFNCTAELTEKITQPMYLCQNIGCKNYDQQVCHICMMESCLKGQNKCVKNEKVKFLGTKLSHCKEK